MVEERLLHHPVSVGEFGGLFRQLALVRTENGEGDQLTGIVAEVFRRHELHLLKDDTRADEQDDRDGELRDDERFPYRVPSRSSAQRSLECFRRLERRQEKGGVGTSDHANDYGNAK